MTSMGSNAMHVKNRHKTQQTKSMKISLESATNSVHHTTLSDTSTL